MHNLKFMTASLSMSKMFYAIVHIFYVINKDIELEIYYAIASSMKNC